MPVATLGARAKFTLDSKDLSGDGNNIKLNLSQNSIDVSTFGSTGWKGYITGMSEGTVDFAGYFDEGADKSDEVVFGMFGAPATPTAFTYHPINSTGGHVVYGGNCFASKYNVTSVPVGPVVFDASFNIDGELSRATV